MRMKLYGHEDSVILSRSYSFLIAIIGSLSTLLISPYLNFDPVNMIKLSALVIGASTILPVTIKNNFHGFKKDSEVSRLIVILAFALILIFFVNLLLNLNNVYQTAWGVFGRNNGVISYVALLVIFLAALRVPYTNVPTMLRIFRICGNLVLCYGLIQVMGLDPINWTGEGPFSTLGNLNFSAAFLAIHASYLISLAFLEDHSPWHTRIWFGLVACLDVFVVWNTTSIQGLGIVAIAIILLTSRKIRFRKRKLFVPFLTLAVGSGLLVFLGSFGFGPLGSLRQETMLFRVDYWTAGISMIRSNPIFGIGMDSYGNYYREYRNLAAANRNYFDRVTNTSHNIPIDIAVGAGIAAGLCYFILLLFLSSIALKLLFNSNRKLDIYLSIMSIGFISQQFVSINQIGIATWGWILLGLLANAQEKHKVEDSRKIELGLSRKTSIQKSRSKEVLARANVMRPTWSRFVLATFPIIGTILIFGPMSADLNFNSAVKSGDVQRQAKISSGFGGNQFLMESALKSAVASNDANKVNEIASMLVTKYPRSYYGWQVRAGLVTLSREERASALAELRELDPLNLDIPNEPLE